jgi:hypothetical protein
VFQFSRRDRRGIEKLSVIGDQSVIERPGIGEMCKHQGKLRVQLLAVARVVLDGNARWLESAAKAKDPNLPEKETVWSENFNGATIIEECSVKERKSH